MKMIDITQIFIVKQEHFDAFLSYINSNLTVNDEIYPLTYLVANIFAYFFIFLFIVTLFIVLRRKNQKLRRAFG